MRAPITGRSSAVTATVTQAIYVNPAFSAIGLGTVSYGTSQSYASGTPLVDATVTKVALGVALGYTNERFSLGAQPQLIYAMVDDHLFGSQRGILLLAGSASVEAKITDALSWTSHGAWQYTQEKLLPGSLLFQIGGFDSVRGYPSDGVGGDSGFFIQNELHWLRSDQVGGIDLYALADFGQVYSTFPTVTTMASIGAGWTATVSSTSFATGGGTPAETIPVGDASYNITALSQATGPATFTPVPVTQLSTTPQPVVSATNVTGNTSVTWNPIIKVTVPPSAIAGLYTATITHSVS